MSITALNWAFSADIAAPAAKFILVALANYADENGYCYPSQARLARDTGMSERSVRRHLSQLEREDQQGNYAYGRKWIERRDRRRQNGSRTSDAFTLNWGSSNRPDCPVDTDQTETAGQSDNRPICPVGPEPTGQSGQDNRPICPDQPANLSGPEPSVKPPEEPKDAREADALTRDPPEKPTKNQRASKEVRARQITEAGAFWFQNAPAIKAAVDEKAWAVWLNRLVPLKDDGKTLTLACTSALAVQVVERDYGELVGAIVDRKIVCEFRAWVVEALAKRDQGRARQGKQASKPSDTILQYRRMELDSAGLHMDAYLSDADRKAADAWFAKGDEVSPQDGETEAA